MKKQAKPELFNILKGLVDSRVPNLQATVRAAHGAKERIEQLQVQISASQKYIENNRYDREEVKETEEEISKSNQEIERLRRNVSSAEHAQSELEAAAKFYQTYRAAKKQSELMSLKKEYDELISRAWDLEELEFGCQINMDSSSRSAELCEQMKRDMSMYRQEYNRIMQQLDIIDARLHQLSR